MNAENRIKGDREQSGEFSELQFNYDTLHSQITEAIQAPNPTERIAALETLVAQYGSVLESVDHIESEVSEEFLDLVVSLTKLLKLEQAKHSFDKSVDKVFSS